MVVVLALITTYSFIDRMVLALLIDPIRQDLDASDIEMSLLVGLAFALFYGIFNIPAGFLVDRANRRLLLGVASVGWSMMTILCGLAQSTTHLFAGRAAMGIAEAVVGPLTFSLIRDSVPARSLPMAFSILAMAPMLGATLSLGGGGYVLHFINDGGLAAVPFVGGLKPWQATLIAVGLCGLPLSLLLLTIREPARGVAPEGTTVGSLYAGLLDALRFMAARRAQYVPLLAYAALAAMMSFGMSAWLVAGLGRAWGVQPERIGPALGLMSLIGGIGALAVGGLLMNRSLVKGRSVLPYATVSVAGMAAGLGLLPLASSYPLALLASLPGLVFVGITNAVGATILTQITPAHLTGRVSAIYLLLQTMVGQTLGPLIVAILSERVFAGANALLQGIAAAELALAAAALTAAAMLRRALRKGSEQTSF